MCNRLSVRLCVAVLSGGLFFAAPPPLAAQQRASVPAVNTASRAQVVALYRHYYLNQARPLPTAPGWTGSVAALNPGTVADDYLRATLGRVNYFRAMSGLRGDVAFDAAANAQCQQVALMMAAERNVSHRPPSSWRGYTRAAATTANQADLCMNWDADNGPGAVDRYMADDGPSNAAVGHRRWLLQPAAALMAAGIVPVRGREHPGANAIWVQRAVAVPEGTRLATAWPPAGFVPAPLVFARWSFSCANADFHGATVSVSKNGVALPVVHERVSHQTQPDGTGAGVGLNTLVWTLPGNTVNPAADESYWVEINGVRVNGARRSFNYPVVSIDPNNAAAGQDTLLVRNDLASGVDPALVMVTAELGR